MLSRIAENVYWVGRYVERADDTVRLVASQYYGQLQIGTSDEGLLPDDLLAVLGSMPPSGASTSMRRTVTRCVIDTDNQSSVASCLYAARENARRSREVLPLELWETLGTATRYLDGRGQRPLDPEDLLRQVPQWTRAFLGLVELSMPRGSAWTTLRLGTMVERVDMTLRVLILASDTAAGQPADDPLTAHLWFTALRACAALDAFCASTPGFPTGRSVARVLLRDGSCPRSVLFCVRSIGELAPGGAVGQDADRLVRVLRGGLPDTPLEHGSGELRELLNDCHRLHESITTSYLRLAEAS
jgi:uncharacterized alpha-E superfamily protein